MCCSSAKQLASREAVPACCHILCPVKPQGQIQAAQFKKSIFEAKHICSEQKPHLRSLNMQAAYKIHAGFLQHIQEIFKRLSNMLSPGTLEFLEVWAVCYSLCCSTPQPWQQDTLRSNKSCLSQGSSAVPRYVSCISLWQRLIQLQIDHKVCLTLPIHSSLRK